MFRRGQEVRIKESADNAKGMIGVVLKVCERVCEVQVGQHTMTFLQEDLEPLDRR